MQHFISVTCRCVSTSILLHTRLFPVGHSCSTSFPSLAVACRLGVVLFRESHRRVASNVFHCVFHWGHQASIIPEYRDVDDSQGDPENIVMIHLAQAQVVLQPVVQLLHLGEKRS
jgi:hypothetical protein